MTSIPELILYELINFLPYSFVALYPFRDSLRFSRKNTLLLLAAASLAEICLFVAGNSCINQYHDILSYAGTLISILFYFAAVKNNYGRILFNLFALTNVANYITIASKFFEGIFFPSYARVPYQWTNSLCLAVITILTAAPAFHFTYRYYSKELGFSIDQAIWKKLWLIPLSFYVLWFYVFYYASTLSSLELALRPGTFIFMLVYLAAQCYIYTSIARLVIYLNQSRFLEEANHQLASQSQQYHHIQNSIQEARALRHDMRHHLNVLSNMAHAGQYKELTQYLDEYAGTIPTEQICYCPNVSLNMLLVYYNQRCQLNHTRYSVNLKIGENTGLSDSEVTILFGNLLENAYDACGDVPEEERFITITGKYMQNRILFNIENSSRTALKQNSQGIFLSTKHKGQGIGCESAKRIVRSRGGEIRFLHQDHTFSAFIILPTNIQS